MRIFVRDITVVLALGLSLPALADEAAHSDLHLYGFATQGYVKTDHNNFYGNSEKGSFDFRELGVGASYAVTSNLRVAGLYLSRLAGEADDGRGRVDHLSADVTLHKDASSTTGAKIGRNKIPFGFYNDTRDVAMTRPSIVLPQGVYYDHSRNFLINADGIEVHHESWSEGDYSKLQLMLEQPNGVDNPQTESFYLGANWPGSLKSGYAKGARWLKSFNGERTRLSVFLSRLPITYERGMFDPLQNGKITTDASWWSVSQDVTPQFQVTGEMFLTKLTYENFGPYLSDRTVFPLGYYVQGTYFASSKLDAFLRYDVSYKNKHDKDGSAWNAATGLPKHSAFAKDWAVGFNYHYSSQLMLSAELHAVDGTAYLPASDNLNPLATSQKWNMLATQITYSF